MRNIELAISNGIKEGKWLDISYKNMVNEITYYWIAINDIDLDRRILYVSIFNSNYSLDCKDVSIRFDNILSARVLEFTTYETPEELINKIENNKEQASWLKYESSNNNILRYFIKCNELDNDPFQDSSFLIPGIDLSKLIVDGNIPKTIELNEAQEKIVINYIKKHENKELINSTYNLALSRLAISIGDKEYIILYYDVYFDVKKKSLSISLTPRVNQSFLIEDKKYSLSSYIDMSTTEFVTNLTEYTNEYITEYTELIRDNLRPGEIINEMPEFMMLKRNINSRLYETYYIIEENMKNNNLEYPLKAFFGQVRKPVQRRKEPNIVILDNKVNIDQMRVIYNIMKYPITYVQGPPGTGKTQTIMNVILSNFLNDNSLIICSSNNKPINNIVEKLTFNYSSDEESPIPYLRLGNRDEVLKSTKRIKTLYDFPYEGEILDDLLTNLKENTDNSNKELINYLSIYETKNELLSRIEAANKLLHSINNPYNRLYQNTLKEIHNIENEMNQLPTVTNQDVLNVVTSVYDSMDFRLLMFYKSVKCIKKLKQPRYSELMDIVSNKDEETRITEFNKWCSDDNNIKLLEDAFPIIITTNISAARLGTANHLFDLLIMDEAGQCNPATALLPIARAKKLLLVGDTNQLKPVIVLENTINEKFKQEFNIKDDYDYCSNSILDIMRNHDKISKDIMLTYHYRCGKKIINFSNQRFYNNDLNLDNLKTDGNLLLLDVKNLNSRQRNESFEEAAAIVNYIERNNIKDAAIITPFRNQESLIKRMLKDKNITDCTCGTIHQIQGAEKETIIISPSISPKTSAKTYEWIKNNQEIINVAVTRAKKNLIVVADTEAIDKLSDKNDDISNLVNYIRNNGNIKIPPNNNYSIQIGLSNNSKNEEMFFQTISQFCSVNEKYEVKRNVKLSQIFANDPILSQSNQEFDIVLYRINGTSLIPEIAIELNGGEHFGDYNREKCDSRKIEICRTNNIKLLVIPNSFAKSYETVKELLLNNCGIQTEQLELF